MALYVLGINHQSAPLDVRERVAVAPEKQGDALADLVTRAGVAEVVLVSTCNRTEVYCRAQDEQAVRGWFDAVGKDAGVDLHSHLYCHQDDAAVRHAFRVAAGLDSMVVGEPQILGQVKDSLRTAEAAGTTGPSLQALFQKTFSVAKNIRTETALGEQSVSMAAASLKLAQNVFGDLARTKVLLVGVGEMIELAATYFAAQQPAALVVANRTLSRGEELAQRFAARAIALSELPGRLAEFDVVVSATASTLPIIGKGLVESALKVRRRRPMVIVDFAVPRDVEPQVADVHDVFLYTVDDLGKIVRAGVESRRAAVEEAERIVEREVAQFRTREQSRAAAPAIVGLRRRADQYREAELAKARARLARGEDANAVLEALARGLANKFLHHPSQALSRAGEGERDALARAIEMLYPDAEREAHDE